MTQPPQQQPPMAPPRARRAGSPQTPSAGALRPATPTSARLAAALSRSRAWARPAGTGARVAAFTIDLLVVLLIGVLTRVFTQSLLIGALALLEAAVILAVLEARTGVTIGNLLLRMRTVRDDAPFSPGVARGATRALVQGAGSLVAFIGGIAVAATSAGDPMRMGRSIADRAGRTLVVKVPSNAERQAWAQGAEAWAASAQAMGVAQSSAPAHQAGARQQSPQPAAPVPSVATAAQHPQQAQPQQRPAAQAQPPIPAQPKVRQRSQSQPQAQPQPVAQPQHPALSGAQAPAGQAAPPILRPPAPERGPSTGTVPPATGAAQAMPAGVVPVDAPIATPPPQPVRHVEVGEQLLLTFDTGQRAQLSIPVSVNLGRKPDRSEQDDQLVVVQDSEGTVSKTHLRLDYRGDSVWLTDLGSTNGSEVLDDTGEGSLLTKGSRVRLEDGSRVRIGNRSFTVATVRGGE